MVLIFNKKSVFFKLKFTRSFTVKSVFSTKNNNLLFFIGFSRFFSVYKGVPTGYCHSSPKRKGARWHLIYTNICIVSLSHVFSQIEYKLIFRGVRVKDYLVLSEEAGRPIHVYLILSKELSSVSGLFFAIAGLELFEHVRPTFGDWSGSRNNVKFVRDLFLENPKLDWSGALFSQGFSDAVEAVRSVGVSKTSPSRLQGKNFHLVYENCPISTESLIGQIEQKLEARNCLIQSWVLFIEGKGTDTTSSNFYLEFDTRFTTWSSTFFDVVDSITNKNYACAAKIWNQTSKSDVLNRLDENFVHLNDDFSKRHLIPDARGGCFSSKKGVISMKGFHVGYENCDLDPDFLLSQIKTKLESAGFLVEGYVVLLGVKVVGRARIWDDKLAENKSLNFYFQLSKIFRRPPTFFDVLTSGGKKHECVLLNRWEGPTKKSMLYSILLDYLTCYSRGGCFSGQITPTE